MYTINTIYQVPFQLPLPTFRSRLLGFGQDTQASATHATPIENTQLQFPCIVAPEIGLKNRGDRGSYDVCVFFFKIWCAFLIFFERWKGGTMGQQQKSARNLLLQRWPAAVVLHTISVRAAPLIGESIASNDGEAISTHVISFQSTRYP